MVNKNGSSNGHGSANGIHKDTAVVARNGNGHRPDAAIVGEHDPASSAGLALLWDGLPPAVTNALGQPLDPALVSQRKGRGGKSFDYLEGHVVIDQANRIFGFGGWGYELVGDVTLRQIETVDPQTGEIKTASVYSAPVRVTVAGALPRTDTGFHTVTEETADGHDTALKGAVTDGMKRAFRSFGVQFGNGFYGDQSQAANTPARPERVAAPDQRQVRPGPIQRQLRPGRGAGREAAQAALRDSRRAGPRRRPGADRRHGPDGQGHRRPDGRRAGSAGGGRRHQAPADEAGPGRLACRPNGFGIERGCLLRGAAPLLIYRTRR